MSQREVILQQALALRPEGRAYVATALADRRGAAGNRRVRGELRVPSLFTVLARASVRSAEIGRKTGSSAEPVVREHRDGAFCEGSPRNE